MYVHSEAFPDGSSIPVVYTRPRVGGKNVSPPISWADLPRGTRSIALSVVDI
ncbi:MAG: YbhB/YbcL family Raf kinase inhibitor-like protein, partial [Dissulfurimicrobium sp.]